MTIKLLPIVLFAATQAIAQSDFVAPAPAEGFAEPLASHVAAIRAQAIAAHIELLASPAMEGRGLGSRGLDAATDYVTATLKLAGIAAFGEEGSYFQRVPIRELESEAASIEVERIDGEKKEARRFLCGVDCVASAQPPQTLTAPVVFAAWGMREPGRDDYAGLDVRGKIVMILGGLPPEEIWKKPELEARYAAKSGRARWAAKLEIAKKLGAAAVLGVEDEGFGETIAASVADEERAFRTFDHEARHEPPMLVRVSRSVACAITGEEIFGNDGKAAKPRRTSATASIHIEAQEKLIVSRNILGIVPGTDPNLRDEAVVMGAHVDHLGIVKGVVHPGADDDASGTAALLEIARVFAAAPAKRTMVFVFWTGEEEGHFGSVYYVRHPRWPLDKTVAYLNLDMIGHPWLASEIRKLVTDAKLPDADAYLRVPPETFVEAGLPRGVPALEAAVRKSARGNGLPMHIDWTDGKEGGSDYRDFARANVAFIRFFGNFFPDYHEAGDTFDRLDPAQVERVARFAIAAAWELANR